MAGELDAEVGDMAPRIPNSKSEDADCSHTCGTSTLRTQYSGKLDIVDTVTYTRGTDRNGSIGPCYDGCIIQACVKRAWFQHGLTRSLVLRNAPFASIGEPRHLSRKDSEPLDCFVGPAPRCMSDMPPLALKTGVSGSGWLLIDDGDWIDGLLALRQSCRPIIFSFSSTWSPACVRMQCKLRWDGGKRSMLMGTPEARDPADLERRSNRLIVTGTGYTDDQPEWMNFHQYS